MDPGLSCGGNGSNDMSSNHSMCHMFLSNETFNFHDMMFKSKVVPTQMDLGHGDISKREKINIVSCREMGKFVPSPFDMRIGCYHFNVKVKNTIETSDCKIKLVLRGPTSRKPIWKQCFSLNFTDSTATLFIHLEEMKSGDKGILKTIVGLIVFVLVMIILIVTVFSLRMKTAALHIHIDPVPPVISNNPTVGEMVRNNSLEDHIYEEVSLSDSGTCCNVQENHPSPPTLELDGMSGLHSTYKE